MVALLLKGWVGRLRWDCQRDPGEPPEMEASAKMSMFLESQGLSIKKYRGRSLLPLGRRLLASTINFSFLQATEQQRADHHSFPGTCCFQRPLPPPVSDCCLFWLLTLGCLWGGFSCYQLRVFMGVTPTSADSSDFVIRLAGTVIKKHLLE